MSKLNTSLEGLFTHEPTISGNFDLTPQRHIRIETYQMANID